MGSVLFCDALIASINSLSEWLDSPMANMLFLRSPDISLCMVSSMSLLAILAYSWKVARSCGYDRDARITLNLKYAMINVFNGRNKCKN